MFAGRASEEEEEIRGCAGGGKGRPVGDGHSGGHRSHLQHSQGGSALYPGEWQPRTVNYTKSRLSSCVYLRDFMTTFVTVVCQDGGHSGGVNCVQWHPEDCLLYSGSDDTYIAEWDLQTGKTRRSVFSFAP